MVQIFIDDKPYDVEDGITVIQACESAGVEKFQDFVIMKNFL